MTTVEIRVRGSHTTTLPPELATVRAAVSFDGPAAEPVLAAAAGALARVGASIEERHHAKRGPIIRYAIDQVRTGAHRPWNADGVQLPMVHTAAASITATFVDFDELTRWVSQIASIEGLAVSSIDWDLSEVKRRKSERLARQKAVRDAARRAQDYADALGLGSVAVSAVNDPGLADTVQRKVVMANSMAPGGGPPQLTLRPEDVEIHAEVEATFVIPGRGK